MYFLLWFVMKHIILRPFYPLALFFLYKSNFHSQTAHKICKKITVLTYRFFVNVDLQMSRMKSLKVTRLILNNYSKLVFLLKKYIVGHDIGFKFFKACSSQL